MAGRTKSWTPTREALFFDIVRRTGNISAAARAAKLSRSAVYDRRRQDADFRCELEGVLDEVTDDLEAELRRRAVEGVEKPVYYGGKPCGTVHTYSDNLGMFLLKGRRRSIFGDGKAAVVTAPTGASDAVQSATDRLIEKLDAMTRSQTDGEDCGS